MTAVPSGGVISDAHNTAGREQASHDSTQEHLYTVPNTMSKLSHSQNNSKNNGFYDAVLCEPTPPVSAASSVTSVSPRSSVVSSATFVPTENCNQWDIDDDSDHQCNCTSLADGASNGLSDSNHYFYRSSLGLFGKSGAAADPKAIILRYHGVVLRLSDTKLLKPGVWLNDKWIELYYEYLAKERLNTDVILLMRPAMVQLVTLSSDSLELLPTLPPRLHERSIVFLPIRDSTRQDTGDGTHWSLMVFARCTETFYYYDTLSDHNLPAARMAAAKFARLFQLKEPRFLMMKTPLQDLGGDCGIHVINLTYILCNRVLHNDKSEFGASDVNAIGSNTHASNYPLSLGLPMMTATPCATDTKQRAEREQQIERNWCITDEDLPSANWTRKWLHGLMVSLQERQRATGAMVMGSQNGV